MVLARRSRWMPTAFFTVVLFLLLALALGAHPLKVGAQESTVLDVVAWAYPTGERVGAGSGNCIEIGAGTLNISVGLGAGSDVGPIEFLFSGFGARDPGSKVQTVLNRNGGSYSFNLAGGIYCYSIFNRAYIDLNAPPQLITDLGQSVTIRMTLS